MHRSLLVCFTVILIVLAISCPASASIRQERPNNLEFEFLGRSILYSFGYQRMVTSKLGLDVGFSTYTVGLFFLDDRFYLFPVGCTYYFLENNLSPYLSAGINIVTATFGRGPFDDSETATFGYAGPGLEYRFDMGLTIRGTGYILAGGDVQLWGGVSVGYAF